MKTSLKLFLAALVFAAAVFSSFAQQTFTLNPTQTALVTTGPTDNLANNNYGGAGALAISASGLSKGTFQSVLEFNLSSAASTFNSLYGTGLWTVQSVTIQLNATPNNNTSFFNTTAAGQFNISLMQNNSWVGGNGTPASPSGTGINYNTLQSTYINNSIDQALGTFSFGGNTSGMNTYTLTLSSSMIADLMSGNDMSLRMYANDSAVSYLFNSESFGTSADRPLLTIVAVPEPATLTTFALGAVLLGSLKLRNRRAKR